MARFGRTPAYLGFGAIMALGANQYAGKVDADYRESIAVYKIRWEKPKGWKEEPHSPQSLFLYRDPKTNILLRGASSQVYADHNPTPSLDSKGLANYYLQTTQENMPGWSGEMIEGEQGVGVPFALIRRKRDEKTVVSAFGVRGNTTLVITLSGNGKEQENMPAVEETLRDNLRKISFTRTAWAQK